MEYVGQVIRPPSEAHSIILQATIGCSHNKCTFCGAYKDKQFTIKDRQRIADDLDFASRYCRQQNRLFIADGDALIIPYPKMLGLFQAIREKLHWVQRISLYGSARSIRTKSVEQLVELKKLGLHRIYLGLESGDDSVLTSIQKGETADGMIECATKVHEAKIFLSVTVLLGIAGKEGSHTHAIETARVLTEMKPRQIAALTYMPLANTRLGNDCITGKFHLPDANEMLIELRTLVENLDTSGQFHANHASNYLPIAGRLPRDKNRILKTIDEALLGSREIVAENYRRL